MSPLDGSAGRPGQFKFLINGNWSNALVSISSGSARSHFHTRLGRIATLSELMKHLEGITEDEISTLNIPTTVPLRESYQLIHNADYT